METTHLDALITTGNIASIEKLYESSDENSETRKHLNKKETTFYILKKYCEDFSSFEDIIPILDHGKTIVDFAQEGRWDTFFRTLSHLAESTDSEEVYNSIFLCSTYGGDVARASVLVKRHTMKFGVDEIAFSNFASRMAKLGIGNTTSVVCSGDFIEDEISVIDNLDELNLFITYVEEEYCREEIQFQINYIVRSNKELEEEARRLFPVYFQQDWSLSEEEHTFMQWLFSLVVSYLK